MPILVTDDGENLVESAAILDALDEMATDDDRRLLPKAGPIRRAGLRVCALAMGLADKAVSLFYEGVLRKEEARSAIWMNRCAAQIMDTLGVLEKERTAAGSEHWFGALSHADIAVGCALRFVGEALPKIALDADHPALSAHAARCEGTALFQRAVQPLHVAL